MSTRKNNIYFWSDLHIGQKDILKRRPEFKSLDHMRDSYIRRHNGTVRPQDKCFYIGDAGFCNQEYLLDFTKQLNGTLIFIIGNHDGGTQSLYNAGFDVVLHGAEMYVANERFTLTHCPLRGVFREDVTGMRGSKPHENWHGEDRHKRFSIPAHDGFHGHGHIHSKPGKHILGRQFDFSATAHKAPVSISTIESWIVRTKQLEQGLRRYL